MSAMAPLENNPESTLKDNIKECPEHGVEQVWQGNEVALDIRQKGASKVDLKPRQEMKQPIQKLKRKLKDTKIYEKRICKPISKCID